jgi:O-methyltransferase
MRLVLHSSFRKDNFSSTNFMGFLNELNFHEAFERSLVGTPRELHNQFREIKYRVHLVDWCYNQTKNIPGDFVELGVWWGVFSRFLLERNSSENIKRDFYLIDPWAGKEGSRYEKDIFLDVSLRFKDFKHVKLVRGFAPEALYKLHLNEISFVIIDMNSVVPEIESLEYIWPKLTKGGIIYFDDYAHLDCYELRTSVDRFFQNKVENLLIFPSGNALVVKT